MQSLIFTVKTILLTFEKEFTLIEIHSDLCPSIINLARKTQSVCVSLVFLVAESEGLVCVRIDWFCAKGSMSQDTLLNCASPLF